LLTFYVRYFLKSIFKIKFHFRAFVTIFIVLFYFATNSKWPLHEYY
jgi:hypothetical protein